MYQSLGMKIGLDYKVVHVVLLFIGPGFVGASLNPGQLRIFFAMRESEQLFLEKQLCIQSDFL